MALPVPGLHGAHLRSELVARFGPTRVANAVRGGELRALWRGVLVEPARLLDPWTRAAAALLTAGPRSVLTGVTAATLHGCGAARSPQTHILLPYGCRTRSRDGLVVHQGSGFADDVEELDGLRVLPLDRVVADLLCLLHPQDALAVADQALAAAGDAHELFRKKVGMRLERRHDPRGTVRAAGLLDLASERAESPTESWIRLLVVENGLPIPEVNWPITDAAGRVIYRLDLAWPVLRIALEYDGVDAHAGQEEHDAARRADLRRRGWHVLVVTKDDLRSFTRVVAALRAAFAERGYTW
ncbi:hypothetical protein [Pseudonocardia zijingensis]|jgi:hypothetical protein|uniref:DUF559 domain-containing protein n=1 Tax=Pseudonocardia zijingensis TaxID=153376 RepID=A0ABN1P0U4_9PSEU